MSSERRYKTGVEKTLFVLSRGFCYAPTCKNPVVTIENGEPCVTVSIAHIRAAKEGGPRYDRSQDPEDRKSFPNLLLLCKRHHDKVDGKETWHQYSVDLLRSWKTSREKALADQIAGLDRLTEDHLRKMLVESTAIFRDEMMGAIDEVKGISQEALDMLRSLVDEPFSRPIVDPDSLASLEHSARAISLLEEFAPTLERSSVAISSLDDHDSTLNNFCSAVRKLDDLEIFGYSNDILGHSLDRFSEAVESLQQVDFASVGTGTPTPGSSCRYRSSPAEPTNSRRPSNLSRYRMPSELKRSMITRSALAGAGVILVVQLIGIAFLYHLIK